jgi:hypothetical protein
MGTSYEPLPQFRRDIRGELDFLSYCIVMDHAIVTRYKSEVTHFFIGDFSI